MKEIEIISAPRSLGVFLIQYMSIVPLGTVLAILSVVIFSEAHANYSDLIIILLAGILPLLIIAFIMLYFPNQYLTRFIYDSKKNYYTKLRKGQNQRIMILAMFIQ